MDTKIDQIAGLAPTVHFISESNTPVSNQKEYDSPPTSGIGEDSTPSSPSSSHYSLDSTIDKELKKNSSLEIYEPPNEVKFALDDKDSIISSPESSDEDEDEDDLKKPKIPDGGWGWVVVFSSLIISMIADGISFSFGLLYIEFLNEFNESKSKTAWIGSLFMAVPLLSGPIMSALVDRYGCRKMTILGGLISATGFVLSSRVNSIEVMYLTFGVIAGLGLGLCYVTAVVSIAYWFDKKRTLAVGLGACGTGIGTFVYAPMTQFFIDEFRWRGTTLLLAGTFLNMCVCGCLMRDPEWLKEENNRGSSVGGSKSKLKNGSSCSSVSGRSEANGESNFPGIEEIRELLKSGRGPEYILTALATSTAPPPVDTPKPPQECRSVVSIPTFIKQSEKVPLEVLESLSSNKKLYNVILENYPSLLLCRSTSDKGLNKLCADAVATTRVPVTMSMKIKKAKKLHSPQNTFDENTMSPDQDPTTTPLIGSPTHVIISPSQYKKPPHRSDSLHGLKRQLTGTHTHSHLKHLRLHRNSVMYRGAMMNIHKYRMRASSCPNIYKNSMTTLAKENEEKWYAEFVELLKGMVDFSMFLEFHFLLMSLSTILLFIWFIVPYFYLAEHLTHYGYTETDASKILSVIGITNTVGMIGLGWAGDQPWMNVTKTYSVCLVLCGLSTISMMHFTENYVMLMVSSCCFGLFFASSFSFTPVILVELVPLDRFTTAYGLILLCQGIGNLLGPPLAGLIFDLTGEWVQSFIQAGLWIIVAGILVGIIPFTNNRRIFGDGPLEKDRESVALDRDSVA